MTEAYVPDRGDLVWLQFHPQAGHEQAGLRPAIVLSPQSYNEKSRLALFCPVTTRVKGYPFEVVLATEQVQGVILADQMKSLDWRQRQVRFIAKAPADTLRTVVGVFSSLLPSI